MAEVTAACAGGRRPGRQQGHKSCIAQWIRKIRPSAQTRSTTCKISCSVVKSSSATLNFPSNSSLFLLRVTTHVDSFVCIYIESNRIEQVAVVVVTSSFYFYNLFLTNIDQLLSPTVRHALKQSFFKGMNHSLFAQCTQQSECNSIAVYTPTYCTRPRVPQCTVRWACLSTSKCIRQVVAYLA